MTAPRIPENHPRRLIVEGHDLHVMIQLMARHGLDWEHPKPEVPFVLSAGSAEKALKGLRLALQASYDRVGIVLDADDDLKGRWQAVRGRFASVGIELPPGPPPGGWVAAHEGRRFGAWLMPDNTAGGKLEHFLASLVPAADPTWPWARDAAAGAKQRGAPFREVDTIKAELSTWLAWRSPPGIPYGTAMKALAFSHDTPGALAFVGWFQRLFLEP